MRAKLDGKWKRSYFENEAEAMAYANDQNRRTRKRLGKSLGADSGLAIPKKRFGPGRGRFSGTSESAHLRILAEQRNGYANARAFTADLTLGVEQTLRFRDIQRLRPKPGGRWRINPINEPGLVSMSRIEVTQEADGTIIYRAADSNGFEHIDCSEGLLKNATSQALLLIATEADTQMFLPSFDLPATGSFRMEIVLEAHPAPPPMLAAAVAWEKTFDHLTAALEASQAEIGRQKQTAQQAAESAAQSKVDMASQADTLRQGREAAAQLRAAQASLEASQTEIARQAQALQHSATELQSARIRSDGLETALATWRGRLSALQEMFDAAQADLTRAGQQSRLKDAQINTWESAVAEAHARWTGAITSLSAERSENQELRQRAEALEGALKSSIEQARSDATRLHAALAEEQSEVEVKDEKISELEAERRDLNIAVEAARSQWNQVGAELRAAQFQNGELQAQCELDQEQIEALEKSRRELDYALEIRQNEVYRLSAVLDMQRSSNLGLKGNAALLERSLGDVSRSMVTEGIVVQKEKSRLPSLSKLIFQDIRRIAQPSFGWRIAKALGLLRLAPAGVPRTARERRAIAKDLIAELEDIDRALTLPETPAHEAAAEVPRLFQLRRHAHELVECLKVSKLLFRNAAAWNMIHWAQRSAGKRFAVMPAAVLFDPAWYLSEYPDIAASGLDPLQHYVAFGAREGRNPNPVFDTHWYLTRNPPLNPAKVNPLEHYWQLGAREDRDPSPLFDADWYLAINPDIAATGFNPLFHYLTYGRAEGRHPHPLFDTTWYCSRYREVPVCDALEHYLKWGGRHSLSPHPLFDAPWYLREHGDVAESGLDPLVHYLCYGAAEGRSPHPLFDAGWYLREAGNTPEAAANPLRHYVLTGARARLSPSPLFDPRFYAEKHPDIPQNEDLFRHYLTVGWRLGYRPAPSFDPKRYLRTHPDVALRGLEPLAHSRLGVGACRTA